MCLLHSYVAKQKDGDGPELCVFSERHKLKVFSFFFLIKTLV